MSSNRASKRKPGRPLASRNNKQQALIRSARQLFLSLPYKQVTTRDIASSAGVDSGLINYYFGSKQKLYEAMISECYQSALTRLKQMKNAPPSSITELFELVYQVYGEHPELSLLILKTLLLDDGPSRSFLLRDIVVLLRQYVIGVFDKLQRQGAIDPELDTRLLEDAFAGLCLRPFQMHHVWIRTKGEEETDRYIKSLMRQNAMLFARAVVSNQLDASCSETL
jgi:AcrR family transcriptional regulator